MMLLAQSPPVVPLTPLKVPPGSGRVWVKRGSGGCSAWTSLSRLFLLQIPNFYFYKVAGVSGVSGTRQSWYWKYKVGW